MRKTTWTTFTLATISGLAACTSHAPSAGDDAGVARDAGVSTRPNRPSPATGTRAEETRTHLHGKGSDAGTGATSADTAPSSAHEATGDAGAMGDTYRAVDASDATGASLASGTDRTGDTLASSTETADTSDDAEREGCPEGYQSSASGCDDVDECEGLSVDAPACGLNTLCENELGSFSCSCWPGYVGDPAVRCCPPAPPPALNSSIVLSSGHVDVLALSYDCLTGELAVSSNDDTQPLYGPVLRSVDSVLIHGQANALLEVPPDMPDGWSFLGEAGSMVWIIPESQLESLIWPGWNSSGVANGLFAGDALTLRLTGVEGPGRFVGFLSDYPSPTVLFELESGLDAVPIHPRTHFHMNWLFSEAGLYHLHFELSGERVADAASISRQVVLRFFLGELSELPVTEPTVLELSGALPSYQVGDRLELTATPRGASTDFETRWSRQCSSEPAAWESVGEGATLDVEVRSDDIGCQFRAVLLDDSGAEHATSQALAPYIY